MTTDSNNMSSNNNDNVMVYARLGSKLCINNDSNMNLYIDKNEPENIYFNDSNYKEKYLNEITYNKWGFNIKNKNTNKTYDLTVYIY